MQSISGIVTATDVARNQFVQLAGPIPDVIGEIEGYIFGTLVHNQRFRADRVDINRALDEGRTIAGVADMDFGRLLSAT